MIKARNDYVCQLEELSNVTIQEFRVSLLKFYRYSSLDTESVLSHILSSETGMKVHRLMGHMD